MSKVENHYWPTKEYAVPPIIRDTRLRTLVSHHCAGIISDKALKNTDTYPQYHVRLATTTKNTLPPIRPCHTTYGTRLGRKATILDCAKNNPAAQVKQCGFLTAKHNVHDCTNGQWTCHWENTALNLRPARAYITSQERSSVLPTKRKLNFALPNTQESGVIRRHVTSHHSEILDRIQYTWLAQQADRTEPSCRADHVADPRRRTSHTKHVYITPSNMPVIHQRSLIGEESVALPEQTTDRIRDMNTVYDDKNMNAVPGPRYNDRASTLPTYTKRTRKTGDINAIKPDHAALSAAGSANMHCNNNDAKAGDASDNISVTRASHADGAMVLSLKLIAIGRTRPRKGTPTKTKTRDSQTVRTPERSQWRMTRDTIICEVLDRWQRQTSSLYAEPLPHNLSSPSHKNNSRSISWIWTYYRGYNVGTCVCDKLGISLHDVKGDGIDGPSGSGGDSQSTNKLSHVKGQDKSRHIQGRSTAYWLHHGMEDDQKQPNHVTNMGHKGWISRDEPEWVFGQRPSSSTKHGEVNGKQHFTVLSLGLGNDSKAHRYDDEAVTTDALSFRTEPDVAMHILQLSIANIPRGCGNRCRTLRKIRMCVLHVIAQIEWVLPPYLGFTKATRQILFPEKPKHRSKVMSIMTKTTHQHEMSTFLSLGPEESGSIDPDCANTTITTQHRQRYRIQRKTLCGTRQRLDFHLLSSLAQRPSRVRHHTRFKLRLSLPTSLRRRRRARDDLQQETRKRLLRQCSCRSRRQLRWQPRGRHQSHQQLPLVLNRQNHKQISTVANQPPQGINPHKQTTTEGQADCGEGLVLTPVPHTNCRSPTEIFKGLTEAWEPHAEPHCSNNSRMCAMNVTEERRHYSAKERIHATLAGKHIDWCDDPTAKPPNLNTRRAADCGIHIARRVTPHRNFWNQQHRSHRQQQLPRYLNQKLTPHLRHPHNGGWFHSQEAHSQVLATAVLTSSMKCYHKRSYSMVGHYQTFRELGSFSKFRPNACIATHDGSPARRKHDDILKIDFFHILTGSPKQANEWEIHLLDTSTIDYLVPTKRRRFLESLVMWRSPQSVVREIVSSERAAGLRFWRLETSKLAAVQQTIVTRGTSWAVIIQFNFRKAQASADHMHFCTARTHTKPDVLALSDVVWNSRDGDALIDLSALAQIVLVQTKPGDNALTTPNIKGLVPPIPETHISGSQEEEHAQPHMHTLHRPNGHLTRCWKNRCRISITFVLPTLHEPQLELPSPHHLHTDQLTRQTLTGPEHKQQRPYLIAMIIPYHCLAATNDSGNMATERDPQNLLAQLRQQGLRLHHRQGQKSSPAPVEVRHVNRCASVETLPVRKRMRSYKAANNRTSANKVGASTAAISKQSFNTVKPIKHMCGCLPEMRLESSTLSKHNAIGA